MNDDYKKIQRECEEKSRAFFSVKPEKNKPGNIIYSPSGTKYRVMPDGSWRRIENEIECHG
jgi:hypothetical protein